jgi:HPt (histidine-containing phosphotransfer) domain-containing protein
VYTGIADCIHDSCKRCTGFELKRTKSRRKCPERIKLTKEGKVLTSNTSNNSIAVYMENVINNKEANLMAAEALLCVGGNIALFKEVVAVFLKEYPKSLSDISVAIATGNAAMLHLLSHKLKGSIYNFGDNKTGEIVLKLEIMGIYGDLTGAEEVFFVLVEEMESLKQALQNLVAEKIAG